jgi:predicted DNA-binding transcriptional regulator YafY
MDVHGTVDFANWILSFGDKAKVLESQSLREAIAAELKRAVAQYK